MRVVLLRTNGCRPDPRVEKEAISLIKLKNIDLKVVCWDRESNHAGSWELLEVPNGNVPILRFGCKASWGGGMKANFLPMLKFEWRLFWWLIKHHKEYDTIHACDLLTGLPAWLPCKIFKKQMVYDIFDYYAATAHGPEVLLNCFRKLENGIIGSADCTIICSEKRNEQIRGSNPKELVVLHNSPSSNQIEISGDSNLKVFGRAHRVRIVYVGNLVDDRFITKALACADKLPEVEFHIGGFGVLEDYVRKLDETHKNIFFYGKMAYQDVLALEKQCDIMLALYDPAVPNHAYAAPNKFYEALALGKPLIMFHKTGMDGIIEENGIGAVCDPTEEGLLHAFESLIACREDWPSMGIKMQTLFQEQFSWDIMETRLQNIYLNLELRK